jgi:hypothetical protein
LAARFAELKRGWLVRKSCAASESEPAKKPAPSGDHAHGREQLALGIAGPERVLGLHGGDRVGLLGGEQLLGGRVRDADVADVALAHQLGHRADALLDRHRGVREMQVPEVDDFDVQAPQARLGRLAGALRPCVDRDRLGVMVLHGAAARGDAPLGGELDVAAPAGDRAADQALVVAAAVGVGGVDQGGAGVDRVPQRAQGALVVRGAVHAVDEDHRAVADG